MSINLKAGHVIDTLQKEHEKILSFLDELEKLNKDLQQASSLDNEAEKLDRLLNVAEHLVGADPHHQREEKVLFPKMEEGGITGPTEVMRREHEELRAKKKELLELAKSAGKTEINLFKSKLNILSDFIAPVLREHIFKENEILYPLALSTINGDDVWELMKKECDKIGYCCFSPEE